MVFLAIPTALIIAIIAVVAAILAVLGFLGYKKLSRRTVIKRVEQMVSSIDSNLKIPLENNLKKLRNISNNNESYAEIYNNKYEEFNRLFIEEREKLLTRQRTLRDRVIKEKHTKKLIDQVKKLNDAINSYREEINNLQNSLNDIFRAGDNLRIKATDLKTKLRTINQEVEKNATSLTISYDTLRNYLSEIEMSFDIFETYMAAAKYKEASTALQSLENKILPMVGCVDKMASYNNLVAKKIPEQLQELVERHDQLEKENYVVAQAHVKELVTNINQMLDYCFKEFKRLNFGFFEEMLEEINQKISQSNATMDTEVNDKATLERNYQPVNDKIKQAEDNFIKTKRQYANMEEYYEISDDIKTRFANFISEATNLSDLKRQYDAYIFSTAKNPASYMLEKLNSMSAKADDILAENDYFTDYFISVKKIAEDTYVAVEKMSVELILNLGMIRKNKCKKVYDKYRSSVDDCLNELASINKLLHQKPIKIPYINSMFGNLTNRVNDINLKMKTEFKQYQLVEKSIIFANPLRSQFNEADTMLSEAEIDFDNGNYAQAQNKINQILNRYHPVGFENFSN